MASTSPFLVWYEAYDKRVKALNLSKDALIFDVGEDGKMLAGDINLAKGPEDEFEVIIEDVKSGSWTVTQLATDNDDPADDEFDENAELEGNDEDEDDSPTSKLLVQHAEAELAALANVPWEEIGEFSVDSGVWCLLSNAELEKAIAGAEDRESALESLADWGGDEGPKSPAGIVVPDDDGGYVVKGKKLKGVWVQLNVLDLNEQQ